MQSSTRTTLPQERRLAVWRLQSRRGIFGLVALHNLSTGPGSPKKINMAIPRSKGAVQHLGGRPRMGCSPQREAPQVFR